MSHYILRYREGATADIATVERKLAETEGVRVLQKTELMFLLDVTGAGALAAVEALAPGWLVAPERMIPRPGRGPRPY